MLPHFHRKQLCFFFSIFNVHFHFFSSLCTQPGGLPKAPTKSSPSCSIAWAASPLLFTLLESRGTCVIPCGPPPPPPLSLRGALALRRDRRGLKKGFCSRRTEPTTLKGGGGLPPSWRHCTYKAGVGWHVRCPRPPLLCPLCMLLFGRRLLLRRRMVLLRDIQHREETSRVA